MNRDALHFTFEDYCEVIKAVAPCMDDYLYIYDIKQDLYYISEKALDRFVIPSNFFSDVVNTHRLFVHKEDVEMLIEDIQKVVSGQKDEHNIKYRWIGKDENAIWINCVGHVIKNAQGESAYMIGCVNEIGLRQKADNVSGLLESSVIAGTLDTFAQDVKNGYILHIGIDDFKEINERFGLDYGDYILRGVADCIVKALKEGQEVYRAVADEYIVIDYNGGETKDMIALYEKIRNNVDTFIEENRYEAIFTISGGVVTSKDLSGLHYLEILKLSQFALSQAKSRGRNQVYLFDEKDYKKFIRGREILRSLRESIADKFAGFEVYYQPIMRSDGTGLYSAEALLRYKMPNGESVSPVEFIPILEDSGLIIPVGKWVINQAMSFCKKRQRVQRGFKVNINVSYVQVLKSQFIVEFFRLFREYALSPSSIVVELTESGQIEDSPKIQSVWENLRKYGINIALDDFGTGYSNLLYISEMTPNVVKLDRGFTIKALQNPFENQLMMTTIQMVHSIGLKVCVEGVETAEDLQRINELGPDYIQGYYYGKPCSRQEFFEKFG